LEHIDVINQILEADEKARAATEGAKADRDRLLEDIDKEREKLREEYMTRARARAETEAARERMASDRMLAELDEKLRLDLELVDRRLADRREELAEKVFSMIVGDDEC
jgi:regulator of protease activity HflC (stomatin/prohibitin superfamily)